MTKVFLYAQPLKPEPYIESDALIVGQYELTVKSITSKAFTDIGRSVWMIARALDNEASVKSENADGNIFDWNVEIKTSFFNIAMKCGPYKKTVKDIEDCYVELELDGDDEKIGVFAQFLNENLTTAHLKLQIGMSLLLPLE